MSLENMRKPGSRIVGWKVLATGDTSSGKTFFGLTFPKSIVVDSEDGWAHYEEEAANTIGIIATGSSKELKQLYNDLEDDDETIDSMQTLIIDSKTNIYSNQQVSAMEVEERRAKKKRDDVDDQVVAQRGWGKIKLDTKRLQALEIDLSSKGKFILSMAQELEVIKTVGEKRIVTGYKPDIHKTEKFVYDTIIRFYREKNDDGGYDYYSEILKDRTKVFKAGDIIEGGATYKHWEKYFDSKNKKGNHVAETNYTKNIKEDVKGFNDESEKIDLAKDMSRKFAKEHGKAELAKIFKANKVTGLKDINSIEKATSIINDIKEVD